MRTLRVVNYAVNGSGIGHLQRLVAISRWIRRYAAHAGVRAEIYFLTSSEADALLFHERFASFKLPSKTAVAEAGIDKLAYLALAKQWVWHSLGLLRPDLLVVDSFPRGSFGELLGALDLARARAFVYRPSKESFAARADFQAMLPLYDCLLVPEMDGELPVPAAARDKLRHVGPILVRDRVEMWPRPAAREELGVGERLAVYVSAGGGGDAGAERHIAAVGRLLGGDPGLHLVVGGGPLYRGRRLFGERITWLDGRPAAELLAGLDVAVTAAGYNSWNELMHAGVPSLFLPQDKIADEQEARARRAEAAGAGRVLGRIDELPAALAAYRDPAARARAAAAARALVPRGCARDAAAELLALVLDEAEVEAARQAISDEVLGATRELGLSLEAVVDVMGALAPPDGGRAPRRKRTPPGELSALAVELLREVTARGVPSGAALRVIPLLCRKLGAATPAERAACVRRTLGGLAPFDDWSSAATLMKLLGAERELAAEALAGELDLFLDELRRRGQDLSRGISLISALSGDAASNRELLRGAVAKLEGMA
jgi:predicted glycosyltransferase